MNTSHDSDLITRKLCHYKLFTVVTSENISFQILMIHLKLPLRKFTLCLNLEFFYFIILSVIYLKGCLSYSHKQDLQMYSLQTFEGVYKM